LLEVQGQIWSKFALVGRALLRPAEYDQHMSR
jgi:hypothetical protein